MTRTKETMLKVIFIVAIMAAWTVVLIYGGWTIYNLRGMMVTELALDAISFNGQIVADRIRYYVYMGAVGGAMIISTVAAILGLYRIGVDK